MQTYQLDFPDGDFINPAYALQINLSYILSDITTITGHTSMIIYFEHHFKQRSLIDRARILYKFQKNEPEALVALDNFFYNHQLVKNTKHPPSNVFLAYKKLENTVNKILIDWVDKICVQLEKNGFYTFSRNFKPDILNCLYFGPEQPQAKDLNITVYKTFSNQLTNKGMEGPIWLLAEGFYSHLYFGKGATTEIDAVEEGKPYLIKCLKIPNINILSCEELDILRDAFAKLTTSFRAETDAWATQCYTTKNGINHFKEKVMPLMGGVQDAIDNDPLLKQWGNVESVKNKSAIYFGEVMPEILWEYYKNNGVIPDDEHKQLLDEYAAKENYTIPVMVFAYHLDSLKLKEAPLENEIPKDSVESVRKYVEI